MKFKTHSLKVGIYKTNTELKQALKDKNICVSSLAQDLLEKVESCQPETLDFTIIMGKELGLPNIFTTQEILMEAEKNNLELLPTETAIQILLQHGGLVNGWVTVMSQPITDRGGYPSVFDLYRYGDGQLVLYYDNARPVERWNDDNAFVFRLRKPLGNFGISLETLSLRLSELETFKAKAEKILKLENI